MLLAISGCIPQSQAERSKAPSKASQNAAAVHSEATALSTPAQTASVIFTRTPMGIAAEVTSDLQFVLFGDRMFLTIGDVKVMNEKIKEGTNLHTMVFKPIPFETFNALPDGAMMSIRTENDRSISLDDFAALDKTKSEVTP